MGLSLCGSPFTWGATMKIDMTVKWTDVVTTIAAVAIPIVLADQAAKIQDELHSLEVETRTLSHLRVFDISTRKLLSEMRQIQESLEAVCQDDSAPDCIKANIRIADKASAVLNEYDIFCYGVNEALFSKKVFEDLVSHAIPSVHTNFKEYIEHKKKESGNQNLWDECEKWNQ